MWCVCEYQSRFIVIVIASNKLLSGLVDKERPNSWKRKMSLSDSDGKNLVYSRSVKEGKSLRKECKTISVAPHWRQTSLVGNSFSVVETNAEPCSSKEFPDELIDNVSVRLLD